MSLWRKRGTSDTVATDVHHNEQKPDHLVNILNKLHDENVRLGLYEGVYDLSIKSEDLSIKREKAMREVQRLGQEIQREEHMKYEDIKDFYQRCEEHPDHQSGMISNSMIQQRLYEEIDELREYIEHKFKENT